jgi:hypothetical protein
VKLSYNVCGKKMEWPEGTKGKIAKREKKAKVPTWKTRWLVLVSAVVASSVPLRGGRGLLAS